MNVSIIAVEKKVNFVFNWPVVAEPKSPFFYRQCSMFPFSCYQQPSIVY